jgi:predicted ArsR family transcriptional regulator
MTSYEGGYMNNSNIFKELKREKEKLDILIERAMESPIQELAKNLEIIEQSRKVDELINQLQRERQRGGRPKDEPER